MKILLTLISLLIALTTNAQVTEKTKENIVGVNHVKGVMSLDGKEKNLDGTDGYRMTKGHKAKVVIKNPNTILFKYTPGKTTEEDTPNLLEVKKLGEVLKGLKRFNDGVAEKQSVAASQLAAGKPMLTSIESLDLKKFGDAVFAVSSFIDNDHLTRLMAKVVKAQQDGEAVPENEDAEKISDHLTTIINGLGVLGELSLADSGLADNIRFDVKHKNSTGGEAIRKLDVSSDEILKKDAYANGEIVKGYIYARLEISQLVSEADKIAAIAKYLAEPATADIEIATVEFNPQKIQTVIFEISGNKEFNAFFEKNETLSLARKTAKKYKIPFEPKERFRFKVSPALIYSFVNVSKFEVKENNDNKLILSEAEEEFSALNIAGMLNITFDGFHKDGAYPFVQLGIAAEKDSAAFLAGVGFTFFNDMTLAAGVIYQEVDELASGLKVGQELASANDLKTIDEYKAGLYIQVGYEF